MTNELTDNDNERRLRVLDIVRGTTVDGPGFRTSIYLAGCRHACPGCHNPESWSFDGGEEMTVAQIMDVAREEDFDVTFSGGDPMYHPEEVRIIARKVHDMGHTVWLYTGFTWEELQKNPDLAQVLTEIDVIVDGPFIQALKERDLLFRGSSNQRIIDVARSLESGKVVEWRRE